MTCPLFVKRQAQWDAFHRWESSKALAPITLEERIAWYSAASSFSRQHAHCPGPGQIEARVSEIQRVRERLAHLEQADRNV